MPKAFEPFELTSHLNSGTGNVETGRSPLWPAASDADPSRTALSYLPGGVCKFWGVPFRLADPDEDPVTKTIVVAAQDAGPGLGLHRRAGVVSRSRRVIPVD